MKLVKDFNWSHFLEYAEQSLFLNDHGKLKWHSCVINQCNQQNRHPVTFPSMYM